MTRTGPKRLEVLVTGGLLCAAFLLVRPPMATPQPAPLEGLDSYVEQAMEEWNVPGLSLAVVEDDSVVYTQGYGVRERGTEKPVDRHTLFGIGSATKAFTAVILGQLVDQGELDWDDRVTDYLPWFQLEDPWVTRELTVRDVLAHRTGLGRCDRLWIHTEYSRRELLRRVRYCERESSFRSQFSYQNIMYVAAGRIAAEVTGKPWDELIERRIFEPLGMRRSNTSVDSLEGMRNVATAHEEMEEGARPVPRKGTDHTGPAGSINSSASEMAEWIRLQLNEGVYEGKRLLADSTVAEMQAIATLRPTPPGFSFLPEGPFVGYGLGWSLQEYRDRKLVWHAGRTLGMRADVGMIPEEGLGVVVLTNRAPEGLGTPLMLRILDAYLESPSTNWVAQAKSVLDSLAGIEQRREKKLREARIENTSPSLALKGYAGTYRNQPYGQVRVTHSGAGLRVEVMDSYGGELSHWHRNTFRVSWDDPAIQAFPLWTQLITFHLDASGRVSALELPPLGTFQATDAGREGS